TEEHLEIARHAPGPGGPSLVQSAGVSRSVNSSRLKASGSRLDGLQARDFRLQASRASTEALGTWHRTRHPARSTRHGRLTLMSGPLYAPARELARLVATRALSPVEVVRATLDRIQEQNPALNAYVAVDADRALDAARAAEHALMHPAPGTSHSSLGAVGALVGVPVSIKSSIAVK